MSVILQHRIYRSDLRNNPGVRYLFGDNEKRQGFGGQAKECRGEPNAIGVATKIKPARSEDAFWSDRDYERCIAIIDLDLAPAFEHIENGGIVIMPSDGLGTGLSELPQRAPKVLEYLVAQLKRLSAD